MLGVEIKLELGSKPLRSSILDDARFEPSTLLSSADLVRHESFYDNIECFENTQVK